MSAVTQFWEKRRVYSLFFSKYCTFLENVGFKSNSGGFNILGDITYYLENENYKSFRIVISEDTVTGQISLLQEKADSDKFLLNIFNGIPQYRVGSDLDLCKYYVIDIKLIGWEESYVMKMCEKLIEDTIKFLPDEERDIKIEKLLKNESV